MEHVPREGGVQSITGGGKPPVLPTERRRLEPQAGGSDAQSKRVRLQMRNTAQSWATSTTSSTGGESIAHATIAGLYDLEETIGKGHFAVVKVARHVFTDERVAVKIIDRTRLAEKERLHLFQEVMCMKLVQHRYIVRLYEVMDTQTRLYLILELADGGDLFDYIMKHRDGLAEAGARRYFRQICTAIAYCHALHVVHRDLKPENVVFFERRRVCKLTDFGFSQRYEPGTQLETACGSLYYSAPEILLGDRYDAPKVDVWSLGVILFMLVCGRAPFQEANDSETLSKIMDCDFRVPQHVSPSCRNLIASMLLRDPSRRASLDRILAHEWTVGPPCICAGSSTNTCSPDMEVVNEEERCAACECDDEEDEDNEPSTEDLQPLVARAALTKEQHDAIVSHMVNGGIAPRESIVDALANDPYSHIAATFFLLAERTLREQRERASVTACVPQQRPRRFNAGRRVPSRTSTGSSSSGDVPQTTVNASGERERETARDRATPAPTVLEVVPESDSPYASENGSAINVREQVEARRHEDVPEEDAGDVDVDGEEDDSEANDGVNNRPWTMRPSSSDSCLSTQVSSVTSGSVTLAVPFGGASSTRRCSQIKEESYIERDGDFEPYSSMHDSRSSQSSRRSSRAGVGGAVICLSRRSSTSSLANSGVSPAHVLAPAQIAIGTKRHSLHGDLTSFLLAAAASISSAASLSPMHLVGMSASASASPVPAGFEIDASGGGNVLSFSVPSSRQPTVEVSEMIIEEEFEASLNANAAATPSGGSNRPNVPPVRGTSRSVHARRLHRSLDHTAGASRSSSSDASDNDEQLGVSLSGTASAVVRRHRRSRAVASHKYSLPLAVSSRRVPLASATSVSLPVRASSTSAAASSRSSTPGVPNHRERETDDVSRRSHQRDTSPASSTIETSVELMDADNDADEQFDEEFADSAREVDMVRPSGGTRSCISDFGETEASRERRSRASVPASRDADVDEDKRSQLAGTALTAARVRQTLALRERSRSEGFGNVNMRARALMQQQQQRKKRSSVNTQQPSVNPASCSPHTGVVSASPSPVHNSMAVRVVNPARGLKTTATAGATSASGVASVNVSVVQHPKVKKSDSNFSCKSDSWVTYSSANAMALSSVSGATVVAIGNDGTIPPVLGEPLPVSVTVTPSGGCTTIHEEECEQLLAAEGTGASQSVVTTGVATVTSTSTASISVVRAPLADYDSMSDLIPMDAGNGPHVTGSASLRRSSSSTGGTHRPSSVLLGSSGTHATQQAQMQAQASWRKSSSYSVPTTAAPASMSRQSSNYSVSVSASSNFSLASLCSSIRSASRYRVADVQMTRTPSSTAMLVVHTLDKARDDSEQPQVVNVLFDTYTHFAPARSFSQHHNHGHGHAAPPRSSSRSSHRTRSSRSQSQSQSQTPASAAHPDHASRRGQTLERGDAQSDDGSCAARRKCSFDSLIEARRNPVLSDALNSPTTDTEEIRVVDPDAVAVAVAVAETELKPEAAENETGFDNEKETGGTCNADTPTETPELRGGRIEEQNGDESGAKRRSKTSARGHPKADSNSNSNSNSVSSVDGDRRLAMLCGVFGRRRSAGGPLHRHSSSPIKQRLAASPVPAADLGVEPTATATAELRPDGVDPSAMQSPLWLGSAHKRSSNLASLSAPGTLQRPDAVDGHDTSSIGRRGSRRAVQCCTVS